MKRYDSYKDSGVEWMNEIPSNWKKSRIRMVGDLYGGLTGKKGDDFNDEDNPSNKPFVPFTNIFNNTYISKDHFQYVNVEENENQNRVLKNDLFFLMSSESYDDLGKCSILLEDVEELYLNSFCKGFRIKDSNVYPLFLNYQLLGSLHKEMISVEGNGFTRINLRQDRLLDIPVFIPPLYEQQQIVSFLDIKTSHIDSLIEKTQRKIELLKEKRNSIINEVVTKGLNPNVEMRDSGVEWIGDIPSHWLFTKFNRFVFFQEGPGLRTFQFTDEGTKVICVTNITENGIDFTYKKFISTDEYFEKYQHFTVEKGDFLLSSSGNSWGKVSEYLDDEKVMLNTSTIRLNTLNSSKYNKSLIPHILKSEVVRKQLEILMTGSCQPNFGPSHLNQLVIPIPPLPEQQQIIEYLDEQTQKINKTISIEEKRIELLKEYRQSLISEVVTGKRKVVE
jgi:type I restriction enzyme S subunit